MESAPLPVELGREVAALSDRRTVKLARIVAALGDAVAAGAGREVWRVAISAIPQLILDGRPPAGLPDLIAMATRCMPPGAMVDAPEVAAVAARPGSTRLVTEARRLHRALAAAGDCASWHTHEPMSA